MLDTENLLNAKHNMKWKKSMSSPTFAKEFKYRILVSELYFSAKMKMIRNIKEKVAWKDEYYATIFQVVLFNNFTFKC